jgi:hypothetical protein
MDLFLMAAPDQKSEDRADGEKNQGADRDPLLVVLKPSEKMIKPR